MVRFRAALALVLTIPVALACGSDDGAPRWDPGPACDVFEDAACIDPGRMQADVVRLAAREWTGRRAGTPGNDAAVDFIADRFARLGLATPPGASSHRDPFPLRVWVPEAAPTLRLGDRSWTAGDGEGLDVVEFSAPGAVASAPVVFAGHGLTIPPFDPAEYPFCPAPPTGYDDFAGVDVAGAVVVLLRGYPGDDLGWRYDCPVDPARCGPGSCFTATYKVRRAAAAGAAAVVFAPRSGGNGATADHFRLAASGVTIPVVQVTGAAAGAVLPAAAWQAEIDATRAPSSHAITGLSASVEVRSRVEERHPENVIAVFPGSDPALADEVVVVGAHLDHMGEVPFRDRWYPGADDNASGTAVLLELARAIALSETRPRRTLVLAAWNAEELGLIGSFHYVDAPPFPLEDTVAAFSIDMVGDGDPGLLVYGGLDHPWLADTMEEGADALGLPAAWPVFPIGPSGGSDHFPFELAGVPGVLLLTPQFEDHGAYHSPADTSAVVSRETLESAAKLAWAAIRQLALGEEVTPESALARAGEGALRGAPQDGPACFGPSPGLAADRD